MPTRRTLVSGVAALTLAGSLLGASAPAFAASSTPGSTAAAKAPVLGEARAICARAPRIEARITRALARLAGPATERGSIARLTKRVDKARAAGDSAIETYLNDRLTTRKGLVGTLTRRQADLKTVETWCSANSLPMNGS